MAGRNAQFGGGNDPLPGDAAKEWTGGDEDWLYSMLYVSYSY